MSLGFWFWYSIWQVQDSRSGFLLPTLPHLPAPRSPLPSSPSLHNITVACGGDRGSPSRFDLGAKVAWVMVLVPRFDLGAAGRTCWF